MGRGNNMDQVRCRDCGRWISYFDITKTFDGCNYCEGSSEDEKAEERADTMREMNKDG